MKHMPSDIFILLDENIPFAFIDFFEKRNCSVEHIKKIGKSGIKNGEVYKYAEKGKRWIVTRDADFQNYFKYHKYEIGGVILFKTSISKTSDLLKILAKFWQKHHENLHTKLLITIEDDTVTVLE